MLLGAAHVCEKECDKECAPGRRRAHGRGGTHMHSRWLSGVISDGYYLRGPGSRHSCIIRSIMTLPAAALLHACPSAAVPARGGSSRYPPPTPRSAACSAASQRQALGLAVTLARAPPPAARALSDARPAARPCMPARAGRLGRGCSSGAVTSSAHTARCVTMLSSGAAFSQAWMSILAHWASSSVIGSGLVQLVLTLTCVPPTWSRWASSSAAGSEHGCNGTGFPAWSGAASRGAPRE